MGRVATVGNFKLTDPYTQISILPNSNTEMMDATFRTFTNCRFDYLSDDIYVSSDPLVKEGILKSFTDSREWSNRRLDITAAMRNYYRMSLPSGFNKYRFAQVPEHWFVLWPIQEVKSQTGISWAGRSSIWLGTGQIYRYFEEDAKQALVFNLIFDFYELDRQKAMLTAREDSEEALIADLKTAYSKTHNEVYFMLNDIDLSFKRYQAMFKTNDAIKKGLNIDNFMRLFEESNLYSTNRLYQMDFIVGLQKAALDGMQTDEKLRLAMLEEVVLLYTRAVQILLDNKSTNVELMDQVLELLENAYTRSFKKDEFCNYINSMKEKLGFFQDQSRFLKTKCLK